MITNFPILNDLNLVRMLVREHADRHFPLLQYKQITASAAFDTYHDEVPEDMKRWLDPVELRGYVVPEGQTHPLTIFGIEEVRGTQLFADVRNLVAAGLATEDATTREVILTARSGDRFTYSDGVVYDVLEWRLGATFANTDSPIFYMATAERVRRPATDFEPLTLGG